MRNRSKVTHLGACMNVYIAGTCRRRENALCKVFVCEFVNGIGQAFHVLGDGEFSE